MWKANLTIYREYVPATNRFHSHHIYVFQIRPFDPNDSDKAKRENVDVVIDQTVKSTQEYADGNKTRHKGLSKPVGQTRCFSGGLMRNSFRWQGG